MNEAALYDIIRSPLISEKSTAMGSNNQYVFLASMSANKVDVKKAVEKIFSVKVKSVQTHIRKGKTKKFRGHSGKRSDAKYAVVTLEKGAEIDLAGGIK